MKVWKRVLSIVLDILIVIVLLFAVIALVSAVTAQNNNGVGTVFGMTFFNVQSDSMTGTFEKGDMLIGHSYDSEKYQLKVGDIITFWTYESNGDKFINTHRIYSIVNEFTYETKGDKYSEPDESKVITSQIIACYPQQNGKDTFVKLSGFGAVIDFFKTTEGFLLCIVLPLALLCAYEVFNFVKSLKAYNAEKASITAHDEAAEKFAGLSEEEKQQLIKQYLDAQKKADEQQPEKKE